MKKKRLLVSVAFLTCTLLACSKNSNTDTKHNCFNGTGEIKSAEHLNGLGMLYDDDNIYTKTMFHNEECYVRFTNDNKLYINCDIATCLHTDEKCTAISKKMYFIFNDVLYTYDEGGEKIVEASSEKTKFVNSVPEECDSIDADSSIWKVDVLDDEHIAVINARFGYILDNNFNIIYTYTDVGRFSWCKIHNGMFYYVNELEELVSVELESGERNIIDLGIKIFNSDDDGDWIFLSDTDDNLYKYSLVTQECMKISNDALVFSVFDGYIYAQKKGNIQSDKKIMDYDGNIIRDCTEYKDIEMDGLCKINGKIYYSIYDVDKEIPVVAAMNTDGSDYQCYYLEGYN